jgi:Cd2+/Zn2+-exporting ATPase
MGARVFAILGFVLDGFTSAPEAMVVGVFVLAYLSGGTFATRDAITDLLDRHLNVDLLMVLAAPGAAVLDQWLEGATLPACSLDRMRCNTPP